MYLSLYIYIYTHQFVRCINKYIYIYIYILFLCFTRFAQIYSVVFGSNRRSCSKCSAWPRRS